MSDTQNAGDNVTDDQSQNDQGNQTTQDRNWRQLEQAKETAANEANKWRTTALKMAAEAAGFDVTKGITTALINQFEGDEINVATFKAYAEEQGAIPHSVIQQQQAETQVVEDLDNLQNNADKVQQDLQQSQPTPKTVQEQIAEAQKTGDLGAALNAALSVDVVDHFKTVMGPQQNQT